jgi:5-methylcytosine-specific restriction enzyme B
MARYSEHDTKGIHTLAEEWKRACLLQNSSLLWEGERVWTAEVLEAFKACFTDNPDESQDSFEQKFQRQLVDQEANVVKLAAELVFVYFLFPSTISGAHKRDLVQRIASWKQIEVPQAGLDAMKVLDDGIGGTGLAYSTRRFLEIAFLAESARRLVSLPPDERRAVLEDHIKLRALFEEVEGDATRQSRDILLHLLFPDRYERIASRGHKHLIAETFADVLRDTQKSEDLDDQIYAIRSRLESFIPGKELDFYWSPLRECWYVAGESDDDLESLQGLTIKKQIIFYGPPGTGKTHEAKELADRLIRQNLLREWGPNKYFSHPAVKEIVAGRLRRVQFHPGYSYEDFVRGLQLVEGGRTEYRCGILLKTLETMSADTDDMQHVPLVMILDEMNRADLSKVLGECFSLLEDRGQPVQLAGQDDAPASISFPDNLFFIGTMNLIDQSLEQVDFALRRRFLWYFRGFRRPQFLSIAEYQWRQLQNEGRLTKDWERYADEFELLADRAEGLNQLIDQHLSLGPQYQIGHTYFCDVVSFVESDLATRNRQYVLFNRRGDGREETIGTLWRYSLQPLLEQYLSGTDGRERDAFLKSAETVFKTGG